MSRIPPINDSNIMHKTVDEVFSFVESRGTQYENGFLQNLMKYIKADDALKNFYIRFVYECDCVRKIISLNTVQDNKQIVNMLPMIVDDMKKATSIETIAVYDSQFHRALFCAVNENNFLEWYKLNSETLQSFLNNFWKAVGIGTEYHKELLDIHESIYKCIADNDEEGAIEYMQKHFAILLLKLLGMMY